MIYFLIVGVICLAVLTSFNSNKKYRLSKREDVINCYNYTANRYNEILEVFNFAAPKVELKCITYKDTESLIALYSLVNSGRSYLNDSEIKISYAHDAIFHNKYKVYKENIESAEGDLCYVENIIKEIDSMKITDNRIFEEEPLKKEEKSVCSKDENTEFFKGCKTKDELSRRYKALTKIYHPDNNNGDSDMYLAIQAEYENARKRQNSNV